MFNQLNLHFGIDLKPTQLLLNCPARQMILFSMARYGVFFAALPRESP
jgi:hypothetical protein